MKRFVNRLVQMIITLIGVSFLTFCLTYLSPGDPAAMVLEASDTIVSEEVLEQTREEMGLNDPFLVQYGNWVAGVLQGDMGMSYSGKKPVVDKLMEGFTGTVLLAITTIILILVISIPLGIFSAVHRNKIPDFLVRIFSFIGVSMPSFWVGLILLYIFGLKLGWFPIATASVTPSGLVLPALTLAIYQSAKYTRQVRTVILDELNQDYVIGARTRGLSENMILWKHVLPNAVLPLITLLGMSIGWLLGGVAVIETVFAWPGMGRMAVYAITMRDYPLIEGFVLWIAIVYTVINFLVDLSYTYLDPRLKKGEQKMDFIKKNRLFSFYTFLVILVIVVAFLAPVLATHDPYESNMTNVLQMPSSEHILGTDKLGRDTYSRIIYGTQTSLFMTVCLVILTAVIGSLVGILSGYFGGKVETVLMRLADMMLSFPGVVLAIAIAGILGGNIVNTILALVVVSWAKYARLVRSLVIKLRNNDFITAAKVNGTTTFNILWRHILPNILPMVVITGAMDIGTMMMEIAGLSFLGFGAQPPTPEWGLMLNEGRQYIQTAPWLMIYPGVAIFIVVAIFNLWGDSLRDILDPRQD